MNTLRDIAVKRFLKDDEILETIGHSYTKYIFITFIYLGIGVVLYLTYFFLFHNYDFLILKIIYLLAGVVVYILFLMGFLNLYLDCFVITKKALLFFKWDGVLKNSTQTLEREKLIGVDTDQNGLWQAFMKTGNIKVKFEEGERLFDDIFEPSETRSDILKYKEQFTKKPEVVEEKTDEPDKFEMLIDALGEILLEHKQKENIE